MKNKNLGFTLGEVLLAVAIVGLIAALTIPNLNKNINEDKYIALMKSTMGQLDVAVTKVVAEYGNNANAANSCGESKTLNLCYGDILTSFLDVRKNCTTTVAECFSSQSLLDYTGAAISKRGKNNSECGYAFILQNGVAVCIRDIYNISAVSSYWKFDIDVDGSNAGPNMRAVDNFDLSVDNDGVSYFDISSLRDQTGPTYENSRRDNGRGFNSNYDSVAWAFLNGNMDYLRCADQLKWYSKKTCD